MVIPDSYSGSGLPGADKPERNDCVKPPLIALRKLFLIVNPPMKPDVAFMFPFSSTLNVLPQDIPSSPK